MFLDIFAFSFPSFTQKLGTDSFEHSKKSVFKKPITQAISLIVMCRSTSVLSVNSCIDQKGYPMNIGIKLMYLCEF